MPFIITTRRAEVREIPAGEGHPQIEAYRQITGLASTSKISVATFRRAVATLEEVHDRIGEALREHGTGDVTVIDLMCVGESGGTVGPLPDGTVIEVEPCARHELISASGAVSGGRGNLTDAEIVAAYNAAQGS